ncbi:MAG: hypothetical protein ABIL58_08780 [Pseudomonadota bacterium]
MNRQSYKGLGTLLLAIAAVALVAGGCASYPKPANVQSVQCATKKIQWEVAPEAEISNFDCQPGKYEGDPALIVTMDVKNISDKPQRFKAQVFLDDMDKAYGALVPTKGKPPVLAPGESAPVKLPFVKTDTMSKHMIVFVKTMSE